MTIELIESKIKAMNDDAFHRLVDHYLFYEHGEQFDSINPIGQAEGKQKSRGGTPDTRIQLSNGDYIFIQYTTQDAKKRSDFLKKLREDLEACFDSKRTHIPLQKVDHIILSYNSNPDPSVEPALYELARKHRVTLKLINLSTLSHSIYRFHPYLAKEYLGIELDTYQVLPLDEFIREYEKGGVATPLSNPIIHRESELERTEQSLNTCQITVLSGKAGTGKSRIAVEAVKRFGAGGSRIGYCIRNKDLPVISDLRKLIQKDTDYLLYIDDANKSIAHLREALTFCQESRSTLKIILTVRDYALPEILPLLKEIGHNQITIPGLNDDQLKEIIQAPPFDIRHHAFIRRILDVAHGNPRLAIMTAIAAKDATLRELDNLSDIYERYFQRFQIEHKTLFQLDNLRVLGILSFFKLIDREDTETSALLSKFGVTDNEFWQCVHELDKQEIVNLYTDRSIVKINDQILAAYLFFKCFLVDCVLDYRIVLDHFFPSHKSRVRYTAIEAVNTFGYENLENLIKPFVTQRYHASWSKEADRREFLETFWFYLPEEALHYLNQQIVPLPERSLALQDKIGYAHSEKQLLMQGDQVLNKDEKDDLFDLLWTIQEAVSPYFDTATELLFFLLEKRPELAERAARLIQGSLSFSHPDPGYWQYREAQFNQLFQKELQAGKIHLDYLFFRLCPHFLKTHFQANSFAGKNKIRFGKVDIVLTEEIKEIRTFYWKRLEIYFPLYPKISVHVLRSVLDGYWMDFNQEIALFDEPHTVSILSNCLNSDQLDHLLLIQRFSDKMKRRKLIGEELLKLGKQCTDHWKYKWFAALDWNMLRNKERYEYELEGRDWDKIEKRLDKLKHKELLTTFPFHTSGEFLSVFEFLLECMDADNWDFYNIASSTNILFIHFFETSPNEFIVFLAQAVQNERFVRTTRYESLFKNIINFDPALIVPLEQLIEHSHVSYRQVLLLALYDILPRELITEKHYARYSSILLNLEGRLYLEFKNEQHFRRFNGNFLPEHLNALLTRSKLGACTFILDRNDFLISHYELLKHEPKLIREIYLYQDFAHDMFDFECKQFIFLLKQDRFFFETYLSSIVKDKKFRRQEQRHLGSLWKQENFLRLITKAVDYLFKKRNTHWRIESTIEDLFDQISGVTDFDNRKLDFFTLYIDKNFKNSEKMKFCFKIINDKLSAQKDNLALQFLRLNPALDDFKKINWTASGVVLHSGDFIAGERDSAIYTRLKELIQTLEPKRNFLGHLDFLNQRIDYARRSAAYDRRYNFRDDE
ncbi:hypothetical protein WG906_04795 [Pedobacter sp. P351]|uniref:hypothetical protein n=1 Tax=Pedobacter superstes TaxID=3133441 RepID=UPI00309A7F98